MQTQKIPTGLTLVTGQTQHWNNDSAPLLRRQAAFCGSVDGRVLSGPQQNIDVALSSQNSLPSIHPTKIPLEDNSVTPFNINTEQGYLRHTQVNSRSQANNPPLSSQNTLPLPKPSRQLHKPQPGVPAQNGQLPGSVKCNKADFVESLVDVAAMIIESIWSNHSASTKTKILPLRVFIRETLQRSRTSFSTLQTALFYLFRVKDLIPRAGSISSAVKDMSLSSTPPMSPIISVFDIGGDGIGMPTTAFPFPSPPLTPAQVINHGTASQDTSSSTNGKTQSSYGSLDPVYCARRMFLASLIVASKFLQDRNYSNKAWAKITGLSSSEINHNEIAFLRLIDYRLFIPPPAFARWSSMLINYINHSQAAKAANATRGDTNDSSSTGPSVAAQFNSELTTSCLSSNPVQCRTDSTQTGAPVPLNITLPCRDSRKGTAGLMSSQCQDKPTINQVNMLSPSILDQVSSKKPINNCLMAEYHANPAQCLSTLPNCAQSNTHPPESGSPYLVQESSVSKVRYVRECISNIRNQQCSSEQQQLTSRNTNDLMKHNQSGVRPALGYRSKSRTEISPYPTTPVRSKSSPHFNESNHHFYLSQPTQFVSSNQVLPIPDVEGETRLN